MKGKIDAKWLYESVAVLLSRFFRDVETCQYEYITVYFGFVDPTLHPLNQSRPPATVGGSVLDMSCHPNSFLPKGPKDSPGPVRAVRGIAEERFYSCSSILAWISKPMILFAYTSDAYVSISLFRRKKKVKTVDERLIER